MLAPQHARELLEILQAARLLRVQTVAAPATPGSPTSVLAACFGSPPAVAAAAPPGQEQRFYFSAPGACFTAPRVLPPQALLPCAVPAAAGA